MADARRLERLKEVGLPDDLVVIEDTELEALLGPPRAGDPDLPDTPIDEDDPAIILFTSGTTGRPKGATISHRQFVHSAQVILFQGAMGALLAPPPPADAPPRPQPSTLCVSPLFHVSGALPLSVAPATGPEDGVPAGRAGGTSSPTCSSPRTTTSGRGAACPPSSGACSSTRSSTSSTPRR